MIVTMDNKEEEVVVVVKEEDKVEVIVDVEEDVEIIVEEVAHTNATITKEEVVEETTTTTLKTILNNLFIDYQKYFCFFSIIIFRNELI
jgi:soluble P-type ATPase